MAEYFTRAVVLNRTHKKESDANLVLYTRDFGKISASAKGLLNIHSKLAGHLDVGDIVDVRLTKKENFQVLDALAQKLEVSREIMQFLDFIESMTPYHNPDLRLWHAIEFVLTNRLLCSSGIPPQKVYRRFLEILGLGPKFAKCADCGKAQVVYFSATDIMFLCSDAPGKFSINAEKLVKI
ncbi:MAG: recombination protein O N-terminal domain-containing protein [Candidatus Colwellbacteria bacterium]|nr:recombination protein O N-terminal domain-containing protein [Candidatus Colwellbacteria bacterium]